MSLKNRLFDDMKIAMKEKAAGKAKLSVIRMVRSAIKNKEIELGRELSEQETLEVIVREVKMRRDALPEYEKSGREELVAGLREEIEILSPYLPEQLTALEIEALVRKAICQVKATGLQDLGKVMGIVIPETKGKADGKLVNDMVRRLLS